MVASTNQFTPDYAVSPGTVLQERLDVMGFSQAEFARRCGRTPKLISEIMSGKAPVETETAIQFERVTGLHASIWLGIESDYRLLLTRQAEVERSKGSEEWVNEFPIRELVKRGKISKPSTLSETVSSVLSFFGVGSIEAWQSKYNATSVAYRHSPSFQSNPKSLATWLRLAEIEAEQVECPDYNESAFRKALKKIRALSRKATGPIFREAQDLCRQSGVVLSFVEPLQQVALSGAAWWVSPRRPVIQLSARHLSDDHVWFSLFHEAAHILLHSKRQVFIDAIRAKSDCNGFEESEAESEANVWAQNFLVPRSDWNRFADAFLGSAGEVSHFAEEQDIAPGIIVGRLQREGFLPWNRLNSLKRKLVWTDS